MPIIVRCPPTEFQNVEPSWDKNRCDVGKAPEYIQTISEGVCGIVPGKYLRKGEPNRPGNFTSYIIDLVGQKVEAAKRALVDAAQGRMAAKLKLKIDEAKKLHQETVDEQEKESAWRVLKQSEEVAAQYSKWIKSHLKTLDTIEWPTKKGLESGSQTLGLQFLDQPLVANATGFHFSKGYVMTAAHCVHMESSWDDYRLFFNLRIREPPGSGIQYDSSRSIKRIVLHSFGDPSYGSVHAGARNHDIAVLQIARATKTTAPRPLDGHPLDGYPSRTLSLAREVVELGQGPLGLLGHPHCLPLKYANVYPGYIDAPKVLKVPNGPLASSPLFTADIEVFNGNSGGPLVHNIRSARTGDFRPVVVGIARAARDSSLPPDRGFTQLDVAVRGWLNAAAEKANLSDDERDELVNERQAALPPFRFAPQKGALWDRLTLEQVKATNRELKHRIFFNRVDVIRPFAMPVISSIQDDWRIVKVIVEIDLWPRAPDREVSPTIFVSNVECQESPHTLGKELPMTDADGDHKWYSTYRWVRYIEDVEELNRPFQPLRMVGSPGAEIRAARGFGDMPKELFGSPNGFCSWSKVTVKTDRTDRVGSPEVIIVSGTLSVVFGFERIREVQAIRQIGFTNRLVFVSRKRTEWIAYIGRSTASEGRCGNPWDKPCEPSEEHKITWGERAL